MSSFSEKVYQAVKKIPKGKVATYAQIAVAVKKPLAFRAVGQSLHRNPYHNVPCHRVVNFKGRLAPNFGKGGFKEQKKRLEKEGVGFKSEILVNLNKHRIKQL